MTRPVLSVSSGEGVSDAPLPMASRTTLNLSDASLNEATGKHLPPTCRNSACVVLVMTWFPELCGDHIHIPLISKKKDQWFVYTRKRDQSYKNDIEQYLVGRVRICGVPGWMVFPEL